MVMELQAKTADNGQPHEHYANRDRAAALESCMGDCIQNFPIGSNIQILTLC